MFDFFMLIVMIFSCGVIVVVISKMSQKSYTNEKYHYRCKNNFRHIFSVYEIKNLYDTDKSINCPLHNCGGELVLYELIPDDEVVFND